MADVKVGTDVAEEIHRLIGERLRNGVEPSAVYLGASEYLALRQSASDYVQYAMSRYAHSEIFGIRIYEVREDNHINVY